MKMYNEKDLISPENNTVIGYVDDMAIMTSEDYPNKLFFTKMQKEYVTIGEHLVEAKLFPVEILPQEKRQEIYSKLNL